MGHRSIRKAALLLCGFALVAAACGSDDDTTGPGGSAGLSDEIVISGSSTVEPISVAVAESYRDIQPDVNISVSGPGTGDGFKQFCTGETDISDASRRIKDSEAEDCALNGIEFLELKVAIDGIAVITSVENDAVECLSFPDMYAIVGPESTGVNNWEELNVLAVEVGGYGGFPDAELVISAPGTESGTYDSFIEIVLADIAEQRGLDDPSPRPDYSSAADDNVIIETIGTNPASFGWVGFAFAIEATGVKLLPVSEEADGGCVAPTSETIASNEYPIARDLFIYVNKAKAAASPGLVDFVDHYLEFGLDSAASDVGYVTLADEAKSEVRTVWSGR